MGWAYGVINGREVGYSVEAKCDEPGCETMIDRGLSFVCGDQYDGGEYGCGMHFCEPHRHSAADTNGQCFCLCKKCLDLFEASENCEQDDT